MNCDLSRHIGKKMPGLNASSSKHSGIATVSIFGAVLLCLPQLSSAQQWIFLPIVEIAAQHIDNPRLEETEQTIDITGGLIDIAGELQRNTETSSIMIRPAAAIYRYSGGENENSESFFLDFNAENDGQRSNWRLRGNFRRQEVLRGETTSSEFDDDGIDDSVQTGTGRTAVRRDRDMWRVGPGFTFDVTERTAFRADINHLDVRYDTQALGEAIDYRNTRADVAVVRSLTPESNLELGVFVERYNPDVVDRETDSIGAIVQYDREISELSTLFIRVGAQESDIQTPNAFAGEVSDTSVLWDIGYQRRVERTSFRLELGQSVTPSGSGAVVERNLYRAQLQHELRPRWSVQFSAAFLTSNTAGADELLAVPGTEDPNDRDYVEGRMQLAYQLTRNWTVDGMYKLTHQDFADTPGDAQEHELRLSLIYRPPVPTR